MTTPGSNLYARATRVIATSKFSYVMFTGRINNEIAELVSTYAKPILTTGSVQPVPRNLYEQYGLDFQRSYIMIYASQAVIDVSRDTSGDQVIFPVGGATYNVLSDTRWFPIDGWTAFICVKVIPDVG